MANFDISHFFAIQKKRFDKCLDPAFSCEEKAIRAHSVQNSNALDLIEDDNHVFELKMRIQNGKPNVSLQLVGRRNASTFTGLCAKHDSEIFRPIDTKPLSIDDQEQLFLMAYRSVTRELHATLEGAMRIQTAYLRLVAVGAVPADKPSPEGIEATQHMLKAWAVWRYRHKYFDGALTKNRFNKIKHSICKIENTPPTVAASSFFSVDLKPWGKPFAAAIVNVIPIDTSETTVVFSYASEHSGKVRRYVAPVMVGKGEKRKYELSYLLIDRAENFFLSPRAVNNWHAEKREMIEQEFIRSVFFDKPKRTPELMLF